MNYSDKHFLDLEYTPDQHHENLLSYKAITNRIKKGFDYDFYNSMNIQDFYNHLDNMYMLIEDLIENGIYDIGNYFKEIILVNWHWLINDPLDLDVIIGKLMEIYDTKNWKYANTDEYRIMYYSPYATLLMLAQKIRRLKSQVKKGIDLGEESFDDTIMDLTNYCMIYLIWMAKGMPKLRDVEIKIN